MSNLFCEAGVDLRLGARQNSKISDCRCCEKKVSLLRTCGVISSSGNLKGMSQHQRAEKLDSLADLTSGSCMDVTPPWGWKGLQCCIKPLVPEAAGRVANAVGITLTPYKCDLTHTCPTLTALRKKWQL